MSASAAFDRVVIIRPEHDSTARQSQTFRCVRCITYAGRQFSCSAKVNPAAPERWRTGRPPPQHFTQSHDVSKSLIWQVFSRLSLLTPTLDTSQNRAAIDG